MRRPFFLFIAFLGLFLAGSAHAQDASVRLGFLVNFVRYVDWSETSLRPTSILRLCLAPGDSELSAQFLDLAKQPIAGHTVHVKLVSRPGDVNACHVLYIPADMTGPLTAWINAAQQADALTVGDYPDFVEAGGVIGLVQVAGRYRFDINLRAAKQVDLRISSQLLKLARAVK